MDEAMYYDPYQQQQQYGNMNGTVSRNDNFLSSNSTFVQLRLDTNELIYKINMFLSAKEKVTKLGKDGWYEVEEQTSEPLANKRGVSAIVNIVQFRLNPQVVSGNFNMDQFQNYICWFRKELASQVVLNCYTWDITDSNLNYIIDNICGMVEPFMSRLIGDGERESYKQSIVSREVHSNQKQGGLFSSFFGGGNKQ